MTYILSSDGLTFKNFIRMDFPAFEDVCILPRTETDCGQTDTDTRDHALRLESSNKTQLRRCISARERLCLVIRYLATGRHENSGFYRPPRGC